MGVPVSQVTLVNIVHKFGRSLKDSLAYIKDQLKQANVLHVDETGTRVKGKNHWLHSAGNDRFTYLATHPKRGSEATAAIGILPGFTGTAVHDFWKPYYNYSDCKHAICNAHILRELNGIAENYPQTWPGKMKAGLLEIKQTIADSLGILDLNEFEDFGTRYEAILSLGEKENPLHSKPLNRGQGFANELDQMDSPAATLTKDLIVEGGGLLFSELFESRKAKRYGKKFTEKFITGNITANRHATVQKYESYADCP